MTYNEKLKDPRWQEKREEVILRDKGYCQRCKKRNYNVGAILGNYFFFNEGTSLQDAIYQINKNIQDLNEIVNMSKQLTGDIAQGQYVREVKAVKELITSKNKEIHRQKEYLEEISNKLDPSYIPKIYELDSLNVHHKVYRLGFEPWEYPDEDLITLHPKCHLLTHEENEIPILDEYGKQIGSLSANICSNCGGQGYGDWRPNQGICYECWGDGFILDNPVTT